MRKEDLVSPNKDINENREMALELIQLLGKPPHIATKEDKQWFWVDMETPCDKETAWAYINYNIDTLGDKYNYIFRVTEWFSEFYRYMPELLYDRLDGTGQIDWNLFFTLAYPLPGNLGIPFHTMINKLNVAQLRLVKEKIVQEIYDDKELRKRVYTHGLIPSIYTYYMPYQLIRKRLIELDKRLNRERRQEIDRAIHPKPRPEILELAQLVKEGFTITGSEDGKIFLSK